jgi:hypothetical protein
MADTLDGWIRTDEYCRRYNEKPDALRTRVANGIWQRGVHWAAPNGRGISYVHEERCRAWLRERGRLPETIPE